MTVGMDEASWHPPQRNGVGDAAFISGGAAMVAAWAPFVGEFVSVPAAVTAIVLGVVGARRVERGEASNPLKALAGALLGVAAIFIVFVSLAASGALGSL